MSTAEAKIPDKLIAAVAAQLARNSKVRRKLPGWGRIHIDRQLPFLCVYRQPPLRPDVGTEVLVLGEASYLLASGSPNLHLSLSCLVKKIIHTLVDVFGSFLLLELCSSSKPITPRPDKSDPPKPIFRIVASSRYAPIPVLEILENSLLAINLRGEGAQVYLNYRENFAPPGLQPLLTAQQARQLHCNVLGLEIDPLYYNSETGEVLPFALRAIHRGLTHAFKQTFYSFIHEYTSHRPAHYHELGRRAMTRAVWETDQRLAAISENFDLLLHVTPVNSAAVWQDFKLSQYTAKPEFHYRPRTADPALLKRKLYKIPLERIEDPTLSRLFAEKRDELDRQITLYGDRSTLRFLHGSIQLFGRVEDHLIATAQEILNDLSQTASPSSSRSLTPKEFAQRARQELVYYRSLWPSLPAQVEVRDDITGILVSHGHLFISSNSHIAKERVEACLQHEIGTHIVTYYNGFQQPLKQLYAGMAGYEELQEGLAVCSEFLVGGLKPPRLRILAGRVLAVHCLESGADFIETFRLLHYKLEFQAYTAFTIAMRVYRGGGYTKDQVYLRGLVRLIDYLKNNGSLESLIIGKIALEFLPIVEELQWRKILKPPLLRPRYLDHPLSRKRLQMLREHPYLKTMYNGGDT